LVVGGMGFVVVVEGRCGSSGQEISAT